MINNITPNYTCLIDRINCKKISAKERVKNNKKMFIEMALNGEPRPNKHTHPMGAVFSSYTSPSQPTFDEKFTNTIKRIKPEWILPKYEIYKKTLIKLIKAKKPKPNFKTKEGSAFADFTNPKRKSFDPKFYLFVKKNAPDWLESSMTMATKSKQKIIELAKKGLSMNQIKQKIKTFPNYMRNNSCNKKFRQELKRIRPEFFLTRSEIACEKKKKALLFAKNNKKPDPVLLRHVYRWVHKDDKFREEMIRLSPSWYISKEQTNKKIENANKEIIKIIMSGAKKPDKKTYIGNRMSALFFTNGKSYNKEIHSLAKKKRPEWFRKNYISFSKLKKEVRSYNIKNKFEYTNNLKPHWPASPDCLKQYENDWTNWYDFLGKEKTKFVSYKQCKEQVARLGIESIEEYKQKRKKNWPCNPQSTYKDEWVDWFDFFGKKRIEFLSFEELKKQIKGKIKGQRHYKKTRKDNWPSNPNVYYKEWKNWHDFLGIEK